MVHALILFFVLGFSDEERCMEDILRETNFEDPFFDLELIDIPKYNFNPKTPIEKINGDLNLFGKKIHCGSS